MPGARGLAAAAFACALVWSSSGRADAPAATSPGPAVGFSKLVVRIEGRDEIGIASADYHVRLIERMRAKGLNAVGAENLVFGKDETQRADFLVGGTVRELDCKERRVTFTCRIGVEWQVLDVARDAVVYTVLSRAAIYDHNKDDKERVAGMLLDGAMDSLLRRDDLREAIATREKPQLAAPHFASAALARCAAGRRVSESADDLLQDVVVIKGRNGFGSGFFVSPEGLILTAAHVVDGPLKVRQRDGTETDAVPVRIAPHEDVALLRTAAPLSHRACAVLRDDTPSSGAPVYAVGAPASLDLAFSLTRGIVSGFPVIDGQRRLQTDAPVNPGNSGGPIVDDSGAVLGIVSFKLVSTHIEGVAFAVPTHEALAALGLHVGDAAASSDSRLLSETVATATPDETSAVHDDPDPVPSLDPEADRRREEIQRREREREEERERERDRDDRTPAFAKAMWWGGLTVGVAGLVTIPATYFQVGSTTPQSSFNTLETWNTVGWVALVAGTGSFFASYFFRPPLATTAPSSSLDVGPGGVAWKGSF